MEKFTILSKSLKSHAPYFLFFSLAFFFFKGKKITCWFEFQLKRGKTEYVYIILPYGFTNFNNKTNKTNKKYTYYIQPTKEWVECMPIDIIFHPYTKKLSTHTHEIQYNNTHNIIVHLQANEGHGVKCLLMNYEYFTIHNIIHPFYSRVCIKSAWLFGILSSLPFHESYTRAISTTCFSLKWNLDGKMNMLLI